MRSNSLQAVIPSVCEAAYAFKAPRLYDAAIIVTVLLDFSRPR